MSGYRKLEVIDRNIELNEDWLPNSDLTYTIEFDGVDRFIATLEQENFDRKVVGVENAPKTIVYNMNKKLDEFTDEEIDTILAYRGMTKANDGFEASDVFMEKSHITLMGIKTKIEMEVETFVQFEAGESAEDFLGRTADIYLHSAGDKGYYDKEDLGGNYDIKFV